MKLIDVAESSVSNLEHELAELDVALQLGRMKQDELEALKQTHAKNTTDLNGDFAKRLKVHSANLSALTLHGADLATLQKRADMQKVKVLEVAHSAIVALRNLYAPLLEHAIELAKQQLELQYGEKRARPLSRTVRLFNPIVVGVRRFEPSFLPRDPNFAINYLRDHPLQKSLNGLKGYLEVWPELVLPEPEPAPAAEVQLVEPAPEPAADLQPSALVEPAAA